MNTKTNKNVCTSNLVLPISYFEGYYRNEQCNVVANSFYKAFLLYLEKGKNNTKLLEILSFEKYKPSAQEKELSPSTSAGNV
jgi:hypothetical protein